MSQPPTTPANVNADPPLAGQERWLDKLSRAEIQELVAHRDVMSWLSIAINWGTIFASMALVAAWPGPPATCKPAASCWAARPAGPH